MRAFKLINGYGNEFNLNDTASFFQNVDGIGMARTISSEMAGYDFIETDNEMKQKSIGGEMSFKGTTAYKKYTEFVEFCAIEPLTLCYKPLSRWYYIDVKIEKIAKGEISDKTKRLICPIDFIGMGTWYEVKRSFRAQTSAAAGKKYPYTYPYTYKDTAAGSTIITNTGHVASPCIMHIFGEAVNPSWALIKDGITLLSGGVTATIAEGNKLLVDASPSTMEIAEYTNDGVFVRNLYQASDFSKSRFVTAPIGNSTVTFTHEGITALNAVVEVKQLAETV